MSALFTFPQALEVIGPQPDEKEPDILQLMEAVTLVIEDIVGPIVVRDGLTETFDGGGTAVLLKYLNVTNVFVSVTVCGVMTALVDTSDYASDADSGIVYALSDGVSGLTCGGRFPAGTRNLQISYSSGLTDVPANYLEAAREEFRFLWQLGRQGNRPSFGEAEDAMPDQYHAAGYAVPRRVIELLGKAHRRATRPG